MGENGPTILQPLRVGFLLTTVAFPLFAGDLSVQQ